MKVRRSIAQLVLVTLIAFSITACKSVSTSGQPPQQAKQSSSIKEAGGRGAAELTSDQIRQEAWTVFSRITQPSQENDADSPPVWDTWPSKPASAAELLSFGDHSRLREIPLELVMPFFGQTSNEAAINRALELLETRSGGVEVRFNPAAYRHITDNRLFDSGSLKQILQDLGSAAPEKRDLPSFKPESIVVKATWVTIPEDGYSIDIWNQHDCMVDCFTKVPVMQAKGRPCNLPKISPVLTSCFYHVPDTVLEGNELILVGLHVMTKMLPDWTWATFWWDPKPTAGPYSAGRLPDSQIRHFWRNYLMNATISMETPLEAQPATGKRSATQDECGQEVDQPSRAKICFNPNLEVPGVMENAQLSNCMNCHKRAVYPLSQPKMMGSPRRGVLESNNSCFVNKLRLDYLWSLVPKADTTAGSFLLRLDAKWKQRLQQKRIRLKQRRSHTVSSSR
jgi:hypothetical protein